MQCEVASLVLAWHSSISFCWRPLIAHHYDVRVRCSSRIRSESTTALIVRVTDRKRSSLTVTLTTLSCMYNSRTRELSHRCPTALSVFTGGSRWTACLWILTSLKPSSSALDSDPRVLLTSSISESFKFNRRCVRTLGDTIFSIFLYFFIYFVFLIFFLFWVYFEC